MAGAKNTPSDRWADLTRRVASAVVLLGLGALVIWSQGWLLRGLVSLLVAVMVWELARICGGQHPQMAPARPDPRPALVLALVAGLALLAAFLLAPGWLAWPVLALPVLAGLPLMRADARAGFALFALALLAVGWHLVQMREAMGIGFLIWLIGIVVWSDTLGYFAGRLIGGPKFWPRISPKKTWSGTVAGWLGALVWGFVFAALAGKAPWPLALAGVPICLAGQMGDIAESWLKRRAGVKDASDLIPGHGGLMDRFDALSGAILLAALLLALGWPGQGGW